jgi:alkylation response protein AidB-like acyl-CoA dehydrogenase
VFSPLREKMRGAMFAFTPNEDQKMMQDSVAQLARTTLRPRLRQFEAARGVADDVRKTAHEMGLGLVALPSEIGGAGLGLLTAVLLEEELAWGDPAVAFGFGGPGAFGFAVQELATDDQASRLLARFGEADGHSRFGAVAWGEPAAALDRAGLVTVAQEDADGYRLTGEKAYVTNADRAESFVVFAQVDLALEWSGLGAFVVTRDNPGLAVKPRVTTLGLDAASFGSIVLTNAKVSKLDRLMGKPGRSPVALPTRGGDFDAALVRFFAKNALVMAARGVGLARAAFEITREYCDTRVAFGKPIGHFQAVAFTLADRAMDVDAARALVWRAAWLWDSGAPENDALLATAYAISFTHEAAMRAGDDAVQLHGGAGFMRDYPVEKLMRDAKQLQLCGMTAEQADQLAAAVELGRPLDPGAILPSAETQNAFV